MSASMDPHNPESPAYLLDVTNAIGRSSSKPLKQCIGFHSHTVKVGRFQRLVKVYEGVPPGLITDESVKENMIDVSMRGVFGSS